MNNFSTWRFSLRQTGCCLVVNSPKLNSKVSQSFYFYGARSYNKDPETESELLEDFIYDFLYFIN